jgi:hypothetical protein
MYGMSALWHVGQLVSRLHGMSVNWYVGFMVYRSRLVYRIHGMSASRYIGQLSAEWYVGMSAVLFVG